MVQDEVLVLIQKRNQLQSLSSQKLQTIKPYCSLALIFPKTPIL